MEREQLRGRQREMRRVTCTSKQLRLVLENTHACGLAEAHLTVLCESGKVTHHLQEGLRNERGARAEST